MFAEMLSPATDPQSLVPGLTIFSQGKETFDIHAKP